MAETRDLGPRSPPVRLSSRDREKGSRRLAAASLPVGRGHRGRLEEKREKKHDYLDIPVNDLFSVEAN